MIRVLPDDQIIQIRAGEIIDRPASIVRETVENSLDAGATIISISYDGNTLTIEDDGKGMSPDDLALCLKEHATSKITSIHDLENLRTLGFRGEGLASIAAVAKVVVESRQEKQDGWKIDNTDWVVHPCGMNYGTRITISEIFHRIPARLKFLKSKAQENLAIRNVVEDIALSHPMVNFYLLLGKTKTSFSATDEIGRLKQIYPEFEPQQFYVGNEDVSLNGFVGPGSLAVCVINGRVIRDRYIKNLFDDVTKDFKSSFGYCFFIDVNPKYLDMNVHPAKSEVKFSIDMREFVAKVSDMLGVPKPQKLALSALETMVKEKESKTRIIGQTMNSYVLAETEQGLVIIDQHAAHERLIYEKMKSMVGNMERRVLASPFLIANKNASLIDDVDLEQFGLKAWHMGDGYVIVNEVPSILENFDVKAFVNELLCNLSEKGFVSSSDILDKICSLFACHNAIRFGDALSQDEMAELVGLIEETAKSGYCNHGRPTSFLLSDVDLKKMFHR